MHVSIINAHTTKLTAERAYMFNRVCLVCIVCDTECYVSPAVNNTHQRSLFIQRMLCVQEPVVAKQLSMASTLALRTAAETSFHACVYNNDRVCYNQKSHLFVVITRSV